MKKFRIAFIFIVAFNCMPTNAGIFDSFKKKQKEPEKIITYEDRPKPFEKYFVVNSPIYDIETLSDYIGRIIVLYQDSEGRSKIDIRADKVLKDLNKKPSLKLDNEVYLSTLLDSSVAATFGLPLVGGTISNEDKISYKFYKTANSSVSTNDFNKQKYLELEKAVQEEFKKYKDLRLQDVRIISSAAILNTSYAAMKKTDKNAKVAVPGWQIGGEFYSYQGESKEQFHNDIGIITSRFTPEFTAPITTKPTETILTSITPNNGSLVATEGFSAIEDQPSYSEDAALNASSSPRSTPRFATATKSIELQASVDVNDFKSKAESDAKGKAEADAKRKAEADAKLKAKAESLKAVAPNTTLSGKEGIPVLDSQKSPSESSFKNIIQIQ